MGYAIGADTRPRAKEYVNALVRITGDGGKTGINPIGRRSAGFGAGGSTTTSDYLGYFKLYLISTIVDEQTLYTVRIADGATYVDEETVGGNSICKANNVRFEIAPYLSSVLSVNMLFYLQYDSTNNTVVISSTTESSIPEDTSTILYYQLGRFVYGSSNDSYIIQDHLTGIPQMYLIPASAAYSGYFKLYLISATVEGVTSYGVRIADGKTYVSESSVGGNSTCKVNETSFPIASYFSGALTANTLFYLKYTHATEAVVIESSSTLTIPSDTDALAYYQLGRFYTGTTPYVAQDHSNIGVIVGSSTIPAVVANGIPQIWWVKNEC